MSRIKRFWVKKGMNQETEVLDVKIVIGTDSMDIRLDGKVDSKIAKVPENLLVEHIELPLNSNIIFRRPDLYTTTLDKSLIESVGITPINMIKNFKTRTGSFLSIKVSTDRYLTIAFKKTLDYRTMKISYTIDDGINDDILSEFNNIIKYEVEEFDTDRYLRLPIYTESMSKYPIVSSTVDINGVAINMENVASPIANDKYLLEEISYKYRIDDPECTVDYSSKIINKSPSPLGSDGLIYLDGVVYTNLKDLLNVLAAK